MRKLKIFKFWNKSEPSMYVVICVINYSIKSPIVTIWYSVCELHLCLESASKLEHGGASAPLSYSTTYLNGACTS